MKDHWNWFFLGCGVTVMVIFIATVIGVCVSSIEKDTEPPMPTATTTTFEGQEYTIFYDQHGEICAILPDVIEYD